MDWVKKKSYLVNQKASFKAKVLDQLFFSQVI
jgi:hypothetical protein